MSAPADALRTVLEQERQSLLRGALDELEAFAARKQDLVAALADAPPTRAATARLRAELKRNAALLQAAAEGVRSARDTLDTRRRAARTALYHADGSAQIPPAAGHKVERKA